MMSVLMPLTERQMNTKLFVAAATLGLTFGWNGHALAQAPACVASEPAVACLDSGPVRGTVADGIRSFKGIPYARPPVGALRFRPPQPAEPWSEVRAVEKFGPPCPQMGPNRTVVGNEDCLTINVWAPATPPAAPLPVMVWLTGGGNHSLSGAGSGGFGGVTYDGSLMVERGGVVFVTYNLRLGALGFLAHPALDAERPEKVSGNYGSLDQIAMLQWIKRNIGAFGGDPNRVFLFGTSAGGGNICALMTSPLAQGLFHAASMQSSVPAACELQTIDHARNGTGAQVAEKTGCAGSADVAACLRGKSVEEIVTAVPGTFSVLPRLYGPNVDGHVFPEQPIKMITARRYQPMPVIIGTTAEETLGWADTAGPVTDQASYAAAVEKTFGAGPRDAIMARYPAASYPTPRAAFAAASTDGLFNCVSRRVARALTAAQSEPVFRYFFNHALENDPKEKANGATHTVEHPFFFKFAGRYVPSEAERKLQDAMLAYWSRMARAGNPNGEGTPEWPRSDTAKDGYLELSTQPAAKAGLHAAACDFWDTIPLPAPHI
jgi:para-nitrobenzyl esterase